MPLQPSASYAAFGRNVSEMMKSGHPQAQALAAAFRNQRQHRDTGGGLGIGAGTTGSGIGQANPQIQAALKAYSSLPTEKLQQLAAQYGSAPQGQVVQRLLQARQMGQAPTPQQNTAPAVPQSPQMPQAPQTPGQQQQPPMRRGGGIARLAAGGDPMGISGGAASPWWERSEARDADSGLLSGSTPGRSDQLMATAPSGAYVLPADVVSSLGEGNTLAGAKVWDSILHSMPYGISVPQIRGGIPKAHATVPHIAERAAKGGGVQGKGITGQRIPVALSDGEILVSPQDVWRIGRGNMKRGHAILDTFVMKARKHHIDTLKKLKPPVGAKAA